MNFASGLLRDVGDDRLAGPACRKLGVPVGVVRRCGRSAKLNLVDLVEPHLIGGAGDCRDGRRGAALEIGVARIRGRDRIGADGKHD